jgi:glycosyltransferase involved in cell wall biosynthesis
MKVVLIHDHLAQDGGAEKVLKVFSDMFSESPIYTLLYDKKNVEKHFKYKKIETSVIQRLPGGIKHYQWYLTFMPIAVEFFDLRNFDLVISDTSSFAKGVITSPNTMHICYCHTPTRYLWSDTHQYINELKFNKWFKKIIAMKLNSLRVWDFVAAARVDYFIANSKTVQKRISKYYKRESEVIYPPVETNKFYITKNIDKEKYFLAGCRLAPYKRIDILVEAFKKLGSGYKLKIFGDGVDLKRLQKIAAGAYNIEFLGRVSEEEKAELYSRAQAFLNPQEEDFGITVIESMASGRPVIAYKKGGATETVIEGKTGYFFDKQDSSSVSKAIEKFSKYNFNPEEIKAYAQNFSIENFSKKINSFIERKKSEYNNL